MLHRRIPLMMIIALSVAVLPARAGKAAPLIRNIPMQRIWGQESVTLKTAAEHTSHTFRLPPFRKRKGAVLCLRFEAFVQMPKPGGWNPYLAVSVNDSFLNRYTEAGQERLLKRGESVETSKAGALPWWGRRDGLPVLHTFFGPGGDVLDERVLTQRAEGYWYLLDISDVANFVEIGADDRVEREEPNAIKLVNTVLAGYFPKGAAVPPMALRNIEVGYVDAALANSLRASAFVDYADVAPVATLDGKAFTLHVAQAGGMQLRIGGESFFLASQFSYPAELMQYNTLASDHADGQACWKPRVVMRQAEGVLVNVEAKDYALRRVVTVDGHRICVRDTLVNKSGKPLGLAVYYHLSRNGKPPEDGYRLAGVARDMISGGIAANPTLFLAGERSAAGFLAEDNVLRNQLEVKRRGNVLSAYTRRLGVDAGKSVTLEWTVYPRANTDYFDFVNAVRRDWNTNFTIPGPYVGDTKRIPQRKALIRAIGPWLDFHHNGTQTRDSYAAEVAPLLKEMKRLDPDALCLPKIETNLYTVTRSAIPGGEALPGSSRKTGRYGYVLNKEQTAILENAMGEWSDSLLRWDDGNIIVDTYYQGGDPKAERNMFNLLLYLKDGNKRFRMFMDQIDFVMGLGFNGVYVDQFSMDSPFSRLDRGSYDLWDGHTVDLDEQGRIARKFTDCNLVGATARRKIIDYVTSKGGIIVINGQPTVRETQSLPAIRFQEMGNDGVNPLKFMDGKPPLCFWQARGHLGCPLILGIMWPSKYGPTARERWAEIMTKGVITALRNGVLYYYYWSTIPESGPGAGEYGPVNHMFPFTPVELHAGWLVGKERTITCVSGAYHRPGAEKPRCLLFDIKGREKPGDFRFTRTPEGWRVEVNLNDWNEIAVVQ